MKDIINDVDVELGGSLSSQNFSPYRKVFKPLFDLCFSLALLPILIPVIAVLWAITRRDGSPGFYVQDRVGMNGRVFKCYKMRTMIPDAEAVLEEMCNRNPSLAMEWLTNQKLTNDPRITKIGGFLRTTSLDELPQIWNVIRGDMSLVGPRPFMVEQNSLYRGAGGNAYYHMRPGITGLWQIYGRGTTSFGSRASYDNRYFQKMTLIGDFVLMLKTLRVVYCRTGK